MTVRKVISAGVLVVGLMACAPVSEEPVVIVEPQFDAPVAGDSGLVEREPDSCGADALQNVLSQNEAVIAALGLTQPVRFIRPDTIVTQDYNPMRVNVTVNGAGTILRVACG